MRQCGSEATLLIDDSFNHPAARGAIFGEAVDAAIGELDVPLVAIPIRAIECPPAA